MYVLQDDPGGTTKRVSHSHPATVIIISISAELAFNLQCVDAVGWAAGRASGL